MSCALSDAADAMAEGEVLQLMNCHDADLNEARYLQVIRYKTAKLFEAAAQLGASSARPRQRSRPGWPPMACISVRLSRSSTTCSITRAPKAETGKHLGDDLAEGKPDAAADSCHAARCRRGRSAGEAGDRAGGRDAFSDVLAAVRRSGFAGACRHVAEGEAARAADAISDFRFTVQGFAATIIGFRGIPKLLTPRSPGVGV